MKSVNEFITILHISDLHRNEDGKVTNDQLFSSLVLDSDNYSKTEAENLSKPSVIIVSGDIIYGSHNSDPIKALIEIAEQYIEAGLLLEMLVKEFLNGDKSRIIIIPGNHDIQWNVSKESMKKIEWDKKTKEEQKIIKQQLSDPKNPVRWAWGDLAFYQIKDDSLYNSRLDEFAKFYNSFYEGKRSYSLIPEKQYDIFDIPQYNLTIVGYNSCYRNDHLNRSGLINFSCLSESYVKIREYQKKGRLLFATWHHNISGIPNDNTYLDPRQVKSLNAYGYVLGFHGHQHKSDIVTNYVQFGNSKKIIAISAGTLCSARSHLPTGFKRQYNLLKLNFKEKNCYLFSRETMGDMDDIPIWDKGRINESLTSTILLDIEFPNLENVSNVTEKEIDTLTISLRTGKYKEFFDALETISLDNQIVRKLLIELDDKTDGKYRDKVCSALEQPQEFGEYIMFLDHYIDLRRKDDAIKLLTDGLKRFSHSDTLLLELNKYHTRIYGYGK